MTIVDLFGTAFTSLRTNILRTVLMMLAIVIGVASVIGFTAATEGAKQGIGERIRGLGSDLLFIRPGQGTQGGITQLFNQSLFYEDAIAIGDARLDYVDGIASTTTAGGGVGIIGYAQVIYQGENAPTVLVGTEPSYQPVRDHFVSQGRFISEDDVTKKALVVVLGSNIAQKLFPSEDPVGKSVRVFAGLNAQLGAGFNFTVIGVMEPKGAGGTGDEDDRVFVPLPSFQARVPIIRNPRGLTNVSLINIKLSDQGSAEQAKEDLSVVLRDRHGEDDFTIETQTEVLATATEVSQQLQFLVAIIATISLVVGGICIMAIMLISVTERTREIGIRKAVGAKRLDILLEFMVEAVMVTFVGGVIGVLAGWGVTRIADTLDIGGSDTQFAITSFWVIVGLGVSVLTGILAGVYPAWRASRLDPIEALRHE
jgi:putative ABC transport system permease protein